MTGQQTATGNDNTVSDSLIDASFFKVCFFTPGIILIALQTPVMRNA